MRTREKTRGAFCLAISQNCRDHDRERFEHIISKDPHFSLRYAEWLGRRWSLGEKTIRKSGTYAYLYAKNVIKGRWEEGEDAIAKNTWAAALYAIEVLKSRWAPAEKMILEKGSKYICMYAQNVIKGRWREGEDAILDRFHDVAPHYAQSIIKGRWLESEHLFKNNFREVWLYIQRVVKGRWLEIEDALLKSRTSDYFDNQVNLGRYEIRDLYLMRYLQKPSKDFENRMRKSKKDFAKKTSLLCSYAQNCLNGRLPDDLHNMMILVGDESSRNYIKFLESIPGASAAL